MASTVITKDTLQFLKQLKKNNNRDWFAQNKKTFKAHETHIKVFLRALMEKMEMHDELEKMKMFRIYRDVRFSNDKTPYKTHFSGSYTRTGAKLRGGYFISIQPGGSFIGSGFWNPDKEDLLRIRKEFELDATEIREVINNVKLKKTWGELQGDAVKTSPKGFDREHPDIDLIKRKQFIFTRRFSDEEVLSVNFMEEVNLSFKTIRPYFDLMSDILTTDLNGESLLP